MVYTTISDVSAELGGYVINTSSTPTSAQVEEWITESESIINEISGTSFNVNTASNEIIDYDGSGSVFLGHAPIINMTTLEFENNGIGAETENWISLLEGRTADKDYYVYNNEGEILFHSNKVRFGYQNLRASYTWGYETVPSNVKRLATLMTAKRVTDSIMNSSATNEGGSLSVGTISISDPSVFGLNSRKQMASEINELTKNIGKLKTFRITRNFGY